MKVCKTGVKAAVCFCIYVRSAIILKPCVWRGKNYKYIQNFCPYQNGLDHFGDFHINETIIIKLMSENGCDSVKCIQLFHYNSLRQIFVNRVMKSGFHKSRRLLQ